MATREHNREAKWISNTEKELEGLEKGPNMKMHINSLRATLKKIPNWKTSDHDGIHRFWFKKFTSINDRLDA